MSRTDVALLIAAALAIRWVFRAVVVPLRPCRWCGGTGSNPFSTARRRGRCWFCHGDSERLVLGARAVHHILRHITSTSKGWRR